MEILLAKSVSATLSLTLVEKQNPFTQKRPTVQGEKESSKAASFGEMEKGDNDMESDSENYDEFYNDKGFLGGG